MNIIKGIKYNLKGLWLGIKTPKLLFLGFVRFAVVIFITIVSSGLILAYHQEILGLIWARPESPWITWLWHVLSWLLSLMLLGLAAVLSYLVSQVLFSVIIMDYMSRITELMVTGKVNEPERLSLLRLFSYLIKQEIPRTIIPVLLSLLLMILGFLTPLGPITAILASCMAVIFLSWDNTDLLPARRLLPFKERFKLLSKTILFHLGFGLWFLVPGLNILFLSFAPVGATLYYIEKYDVKED
jgi:CysZ protein